MTAMGALLREPCGVALAEWLAGYSAKDLARLVGCEARTAKAWKAGEPPQFHHLLSMVALWGRPFVEHLFAPALAAPTAAGLTARLEALETQLRLIREGLAYDARSAAPPLSPAAAAGVGASGGGGVARPPGSGLGRSTHAALGRGIATTVAVIAVLAALAAGDVLRRPARTRYARVGVAQVVDRGAA